MAKACIKTLCQLNSQEIDAWNQYIPQVFADGREDPESNIERYISQAQTSLLSIGGVLDDILKTATDSIRAHNRNRIRSRGHQNHLRRRFGT